MMKYLKAFFYRIRFYVIKTFWKPADHSRRSIFLQNLINKYWSPTGATNMADKHGCARNLTDESLAYDLPFLLANKSGIHALDLSDNHLESRTMVFLDEKLSGTKIKSLKLSNNPLGEAARNRLPRIITNNKSLTSVDLSNCNLTEQNIADLLRALNSAPNIIELDVSNNQATQLQLTEINKLLTRNEVYNTLKKNHQKKDVLDLERYPLNAQAIKDLAYYISMNTPYFFLESSQHFVKEIKAPILATDLRNEDFEPLIEALKKDDRVTALTMDFRQLSPETEQKIRSQLMFNKARQKMSPKGGIINYIITALTAASILTTMMPGLSFALIFLGAIIGRSLYSIYFFRQLRQAKSYDFSQPENAKVIERGKNSASSYSSYLNPKSYTPMAYLGYTIEKENLSIKYDVKTACFKPKLSQRAG